MGRKVKGQPSGSRNRTTMAFEDFLAGLSTRVVALEPEQVEGEIQSALKECLSLFGTDRINLMRLQPCRTQFMVTHNADVSGTPPYPVGTPLPVSLFPWIARKLIERVVVSFARPEDLPAEAALDRRSLDMFQTRSSTYIPIAALRSSEYSIGISSSADGIDRPEDLLPKLRLLGELIVNTLERSKAELELRERLEEIERLKSRLEQENIVLRTRSRPERA
jgi:hypothetical protein